MSIVRAFFDRPTPSLTADDFTRLERWKWIYTLETQGFTREQARRLLFLRWLFARQRFASGRMR